MANTTGQRMGQTGVKQIWKKVVTALSRKVDKVDGKGLSANDYSNSEKELFHSGVFLDSATGRLYIEDE